MSVACSEMPSSETISPIPTNVTLLQQNLQTPESPENSAKNGAKRFHFKVPPFRVGGASAAPPRPPAGGAPAEVAGGAVGGPYMVAEEYGSTKTDINIDKNASSNDYHEKTRSSTSTSKNAEGAVTEAHPSRPGQNVLRVDWNANSGFFQ